MPVLVQTLIDQTRVLSNLKNNLFYSDDEIGGFISDAAMELDDIFTDAFEHYSQASFDFTLTGGVGFNSVALPTNHQKTQLLLKDPASTNPVPVDPLPNMAERGAGEGMPGLGRCYLVEGDTLEILPASSAAGDYRLLYTPQLGRIWPAPAEFAVRVISDGQLPANRGGPAGPGHTLTENIGPIGSLAIDDITLVSGDRVLIGAGISGVGGSAADNGIYVVTNQGGPGVHWILTRATDFDAASLAEVHQGASVRATAGTVYANKSWVLNSFSGAVDVGPQNWASAILGAYLPNRLFPWQLYIKVHAAIAIRQGRQQPTNDLDAKMAYQRERVIKAAGNRSEGVTQAPLQRRAGNWWNDRIPGGTW